jgi:hypothetical protein
MGYRAKHLAAHAEALDRRQFLRRAAVVGAASWAVPTIVSIDVAGAQQITSPPPEPPPAVDAGEVVAPSAPAPQAAAPLPGPQVAGRDELPRTGMDLDDLAVAGLAATAGGAALLLWSADAETRRS